MTQFPCYLCCWPFHAFFGILGQIDCLNFCSLNLLTSRTVLTDNAVDYFTNSNVGMARFFIFAICLTSLSAVAIAVVIDKSKI